MNKLIFWWHFHQPLYKDYKEEKYSMPWVFLHLIKDYHFFLKLCLRHPGVKQNFNFSPVLLEQIEDYVEKRGAIKDRFVRLFLKEPKDLDQKEKEFVLEHFFSISLDKIILRNERYAELYHKKYRKDAFSENDVLDLQFLFFYSWLSPIEKAEDPALSGAAGRKSFTADDKKALWARIEIMLGEFFGIFKNVCGNPSFEVTISPYYHPILPLLIDTNTVKSMNIPMPSLRFAFPQDANEQIKMAKEYAARFGLDPKGMWPSEGSLDENTFDLLSKNGIRYVGSDDNILRRITNGNIPDAELFTFKGVDIFFRDRRISDRIAFQYQYMDHGQAAADLIHEVKSRKNATIVIMDGENAWEYFAENGLPFLGEVFGKVMSEGIRTYTLGEASTELSKAELNSFIPGSWIDVGFPLWIGSYSKNRSWEILSLIRSSLNEDFIFNEQLKKEVFAAEGSDWNWWYDTYYNASGLNFDRLYKEHLSRIVEVAKLPLGDKVDSFLGPVKESVFYRDPVKFISPFINGKEDNFFEWIYAGFLDTKNISGTMKQTDLKVRKILFGYDFYNLYLRLDYDHFDFDSISVNILRDDLKVFDLNVRTGECRFNSERREDIEIAAGEIVEIKIPFYILSLEKNTDFMFNLQIKNKNNLIEMHPPFSYIKMTRPGEDFNSKNWRV